MCSLENVKYSSTVSLLVWILIKIILKKKQNRSNKIEPHVVKNFKKMLKYVIPIKLFKIYRIFFAFSFVSWA